MRRLRGLPGLRNLVRETRLSAHNFIYPLFVNHGEKQKIPVASMPGIHRFSNDMLVEEALEVCDHGIPAVLLFGIPEKKDPTGSAALADNGVVQQAVKTLKAHFPDLIVITDVCLCEYTDHGHCGVLDGKGTVDNEKTLELLARQAVSHVQAGCDMVAPSDMMDGRIGYIRTRLDEEGFSGTPIMSYAAKYCSSFYGPFRDAAGSAPAFGDRTTYQMDPANRREALREVALDVVEGADIIMIKPALAYLDIIREVANTCPCPVAAYNVSGEYSLIKAAAMKGWVDENGLLMEVLTGIKRAGADMIITYAAKQAARLLAEDKT